MKIERCIYITNSRLPTEKAHGFQICKMCEALAQNGLDLLLLHPYRRQGNQTLQGCSVFDYYGIRPNFQVHTLPNVDVVPLNDWLPNRVATPIFFAHAIGWGLYAALVARQKAADLYYTRDSAIAYWLVQLGLPTVYEAHVVPRWGQRWLLRRIAGCPALRCVVVLTSFIKERLVAMGFPAEQILVLPDSVDLTLFVNLSSQEVCRRRLELPVERPIIGYIGRFQTLGMEKGIPELIEAMIHLPSYGGKEPLLLCVGGPMDVVPSYLDLARRLGVPIHRLRFVDRVPNQEVPFWIRACDVVTIPWAWTEFSAYFTSPLKLFEYMAAGAPIVATDLPSMREVLRHGENAWLAEPGNAVSLAQAIEWTLRNPELAEKLAHRAQSDVQQYTWKARTAQIIHTCEG